MLLLSLPNSNFHIYLSGFPFDSQFADSSIPLFICGGKYETFFMLAHFSWGEAEF